jgi:hypothetical protein
MINIVIKYHMPAILALLRGDDVAISAFVISKFSRFDLTYFMDCATAVRFNLDLPPSSSSDCVVYDDFRVSTI